MKQIKAVNGKGKTVKVWNSCKDAVRELGIDRGALSYRIKTGKAFGGLTYMYVKEDAPRERKVTEKPKTVYVRKDNTVAYEVKDGIVLVTECPYKVLDDGVTRPKVGGSYCCTVCSSFRSKNREKRTVRCSACVYGEKVKENKETKNGKQP